MIEALMLLLPANYVPACDQEKADQGIQAEMNICVLNDFIAADKELNEQWTITSGSDEIARQRLESRMGRSSGVF